MKRLLWPTIIILWGVSAAYYFCVCQPRVRAIKCQMAIDEAVAYQRQLTQGFNPIQPQRAAFMVEE